MDGYGKRVLVVVDDQQTRLSLTRLLALADYNVYLASDGLHALQEVKKRRFDVIVTEYQLPRMSGREFLLLNQVVRPEIPVILLSDGTDDCGDAMVELGAFACVRRPYENHRLLNVLRSATQRLAWDHMMVRNKLVEVPYERRN
ncbi:MAG TPA: response regulator [Nitrospiraceae bacterium]|jgi:CheY-like chemotaxis protein